MNGFWTAIRLLTYFPTPKVEGEESSLLVASLVWFPVVGAGLGAIVGIHEVGIRHLLPNSAVACGVAIALGLLLTRGAHVRGMMVMAGAAFSARDGEQLKELAARRWPTGFGVLAGMVGLMLKYTLLLAIQPESRIWALVLAGGLSRSSIVWTCWRFPYAPIDTGIGSYLVTLAGARDLALALPIIAMGFGTLNPIIAVCAVVGAWALPHLVAMRVSALLDGVNANTLDAVAEIGELGCLAAVAGIGHLIGRGVV
ncbi:MAG TPA: adenosylcobinamide-GDP ribazoletransferase [Armatimonadota bacterium]|nr:adenosylcobinamide-GDP ribazoletransferase [Armatimonadota bacterium]